MGADCKWMEYVNSLGSNQTPSTEAVSPMTVDSMTVDSSQTVAKANIYNKVKHMIMLWNILHCSWVLDRFDDIEPWSKLGIINHHEGMIFQWSIGIYSNDHGHYREF